MPASDKAGCDGYLAELSVNVVFQRDILPAQFLPTGRSFHRFSDDELLIAGALVFTPKFQFTETPFAASTFNLQRGHQLH